MASRKDLSARARGASPPGQEALPDRCGRRYGTLFTLLGAIIAYSAVNAGVGDHSSLKYARSSGLHTITDWRATTSDAEVQKIDYPAPGHDTADGWQPQPDPGVRPGLHALATSSPPLPGKRPPSRGGPAVWITYNPSLSTPTWRP